MSRVRRELRAGAAAVAPMLVGVVPFGFVAGASPVEEGLGGGTAVGLSTIVFAGASQLAAIDVLGDGGSALLAALAAWTINLRMVLYSASLAPHLAHEPLATRLGVAYLLTDQAYAVSIQRWGPVATDAGSRRSLAFYWGAGLTLWVAWQATTLLGAALGPVVPEDVPLGFAVPLVFLVLLLPALTTAPALVAAAGGGAGAVLAAELGAGSSAVIVGALAGIAAGTVADLALGRRRRSDPAAGLDVGGEG